MDRTLSAAGTRRGCRQTPERCQKSGEKERGASGASPAREAKPPDCKTRPAPLQEEMPQLPARENSSSPAAIPGTPLLRQLLLLPAEIWGAEPGRDPWAGSVCSPRCLCSTPAPTQRHLEKMTPSSSGSLSGLGRTSDRPHGQELLQAGVDVSKGSILTNKASKAGGSKARRIKDKQEPREPPEPSGVPTVSLSQTCDISLRAEPSQSSARRFFVKNHNNGVGEGGSDPPVLC
ncbi:uncharacterized protein LOC109022977 [Parus major]|uniref:uncharacterized protein LOC109022977 n=1 Tax=Parus major TaxID=9157 RepID=UPI0008F540B3|nr:uncharacterized protein LOC109022977 [Parus major]